MIAFLDDLIRHRPAWNVLMVWYLRCLSVLLLGGGIIQWARIIGFSPWRGAFFVDMPIEWQTATVFFAVLDLVAAIGLWLTVSWGTVMWLFMALCQIVMHTVFSDMFARRPWVIVFLLITIGVYLALLYLIEREKRAG